MKSYISRKAPDIVFGLTILFLYWPLINAGFIIDDPQHVWFSAKNSISEILFNPPTYWYMYLNPPAFTPMLDLSFKIDSYFFKANPTGYNLHSSLSLFLTASMLYVFLRLYVPRIAAFCGTTLFIVNPTTIAVTGWLSTRHYIEGMFWALLTLYLVKTHDREKGKFRYILSGITYLLASLNKEVYVILPAVAFLISKGNATERLRKTLPLWAGLILYIPYRIYMLGVRAEGYPGSVWTLNEMVQNFYNLPYITLNLLFGNFWPIGVIFIIGLSMIFLIKKKDFYSYITVLVMYSVIALPIIPLSNSHLWPNDKMTLRYIFHITTFLIVIVTIVTGLLYEKRFLYISLLSIIFFAILGLWYHKGIEVRDLYKKYRDDTMMDVIKLVENRDKKYIISTAPRLYNLNWYFNGIKKMYNYFYDLKIDTKVVFLDTLKYHTPELIQDVLNNAGIDDSAKKRLSEEISTFQRNLKEGPLLIDVSWDGYWFNWSFGPSEKGIFCVLFRRADELYSIAYCVPHKDRYYFSPKFAGTLYFRVLGRLFTGEEVLSPEFVVEFPSKGNFSYESHEG
jgi:hypothetical protein